MDRVSAEHSEAWYIYVTSSQCPFWAQMIRGLGLQTREEICKLGVLLDLLYGQVITCCPSNY